MISIFLFTACQFGLTQGNPDFIYSQANDIISGTQEEDIPSQEVSQPPSKQLESNHNTNTTLAENIKIPDELMISEMPELYEDIIYETGIFEKIQSAPPERTDTGSQGLETDSEESTSSCFVEIELLCGPDGWIDRQLHIQTGSEDRFFWNSSCEDEDQSWDYYLSEFFTLTLHHGEDLTLSLCDEEQNCDNLPSKDLGIRVLSNDSELEDIQTPSAWSFAYTCQ